MRPKILFSGLIAGVAVISILVLFKLNGNAQKTTDVADKVEEAPSVLVRTQIVNQKSLDRTLTAFGEVITGRVSTINVPQAGQINQILVIVGQQVRQGETLAILSTDPNAQASYAQALTSAKFAANELRRIEDLASLQLATQSQVDSAKKQLDDAESNLLTQKKLGSNITNLKIPAPFDGVIANLIVAQGERIPAGGGILQLGRTDTLRIQLGIEPAQSRLIRSGMSVNVTSVQDVSKISTVKIGDVQNLVDPKTQLVNAFVDLPAKANSALIPGMRVQGLIHIGNNLVWEVPRQAVLSDEKGAYLFQILDRKAHRIPVTKVIETSNTYGVDGNLHPSIPVVVLGNYELQDGMSVREVGR
ncbi:membrane fusion protein (multidrug efflux system) [Undibacterium sp. GrIS 1.8]|uniref:efflux RND transporter periplasmic adaptor subunit n=1 Tax=unclassified Undibacterium TaxID=2630295 RepID=UPI003399D8EC